MSHHHPLRRSRIAVIIALTVLVVAGGCGDKPRPDLRGFLTDYVKKYPKSELTDIYKLLYQGVYGVGHLIKSEKEAMGYLTEEMNTMAPLSGEALTESCRPDGAMIRVNLRPFKAAGLDPGLLLRAMLETAGNTKGTADEFSALWNEVGNLLEDGGLPFDIDEFNAMTDDLQEQGWPAVHHSDEYSKAYKPAYRVVTAESFKRYFPGKN
jgi:hypothetical protein